MKCREANPGVFPAGAGMIPHGIHWLRQVRGALCKCRGALVEGTAGNVAECFLCAELFPSHRTRDAHTSTPTAPFLIATTSPTTSFPQLLVPHAPRPYRCSSGAFAARTAHTATSGRVVGGKHSASTTIVSTGLRVQALTRAAVMHVTAIIGSQPVASASA